MDTKINKQLRRGALVLGLLVTPLLAATTEPRLTGITGVDETMISYRFQEHFWLASDGTRHLLVNNGNGLDLHSQASAGEAWNFMMTLPDSFDESSADGWMLPNDTLALVWNAENEGLYYGEWGWQVDAGWRIQKLARVGRRDCKRMLRPSLALDPSGRRWLAYTCRLGEQEDARARAALSVSTDHGATWNPVSGNLPTGHVKYTHARILALGNSLMLIYVYGNKQSCERWASQWQVGQRMAKWRYTRLHELATNEGGSDPYCSHYNAIATPSGQVHLAATSEKGALFVQHFKQDKWSPRQHLVPAELRATYMQWALDESGRLILIYNVKHRPNLRISEDGGKTFSSAMELDFIAPAGYQAPYPRLEAPAQIKSELPIVMQITRNDGRMPSEDLLQFEVMD